MISRRKFFGFAAAGSLLLPELLSTTSIFLPPVGGWPSRVERFPIFGFTATRCGDSCSYNDVSRFAASPEHLRRKVRLDLVDDQLVWVPA
jgi:hypothetical protein